MFRDRRADADAEVHVAVEREVADGAAVGAPRRVLERGDDLHGADLGRPAERAGGEGRREEVEGVVARLEIRRDVGDEVHDVRVALDRHEIRHLHRAGQGDAPELVAAEIDQHEMLGALLLVLQQGVGVAPVLLLRRAAGPRAGDRPQAGGAVVEADHRLGRRADQRAAARLQEEEVGGGIDVALRPVEADQVVRGGADEALRDHALDDVALVNVLLHPGHHALVVVGLVHGPWPLDAAPGARRGVGGGGAQHREQLPHPGFGGVEEVGLGGVVLEREGKHGQRVGDVVEDQERVGNDELRQRPLGRKAVRHARLEEVDHLVGEVADESAAEARQARSRGQPVGAHEVAQHGEGLAVVREAPLRDALAHDDVVAEDGDRGPRGDAHEAVAAPPLAALGALEQEDVGVVVREAGQHRDGRLGVGQDRGADGHDRGGRQLVVEGVPRGKGFEQHHGRSWAGEG